MSDARAFGGGYPFERAHSSPLETAEFFHARAARGVTTWTMRLVHPGFGSPGTIIGTTAVSEVDLHNEKVHLGGTFIGRDHWGSGVNAEAKLLVLEHMFERSGFGRVKIQADIRNTRSRDAIVRLGAQYEGIVRRDIRRLDGSWRDTVVYSILASDWPGVKVGLQERIRAALRAAGPVLLEDVPVAL